MLPGLCAARIHTSARCGLSLRLVGWVFGAYFTGLGWFSWTGLNGFDEPAALAIKLQNPMFLIRRNWWICHAKMGRTQRIVCQTRKLVIMMAERLDKSIFGVFATSLRVTLATRGPAREYRQLGASSGLGAPHGASSGSCERASSRICRVFHQRSRASANPYHGQRNSRGFLFKTPQSMIDPNLSCMTGNIRLLFSQRQKWHT